VIESKLFSAPSTTYRVAACAYFTATAAVQFAPCARKDVTPPGIAAPVAVLAQPLQPASTAPLVRVNEGNLVAPCSAHASASHQPHAALSDLVSLKTDTLLDPLRTEPRFRRSSGS